MRQWWHDTAGHQVVIRYPLWQTARPAVQVTDITFPRWAHDKTQCRLLSCASAGYVGYVTLSQCEHSAITPMSTFGHRYVHISMTYATEDDIMQDEHCWIFMQREIQCITQRQAAGYDELIVWRNTLVAVCYVRKNQYVIIECRRW